MTASELVVVFGGRSEIGIELATRLADGARVILAARGTHGLDDASHRLRAAGATAVHTKSFDADDLPGHDRVLQEIAEEHGPIGTWRSACWATRLVPKSTPLMRSRSCTPTMWRRSTC